MTLLDRPMRPPVEFSGSLRARNARSLDVQCLVKAGGSDGFGGDGPMGKITGGDQDHAVLSLVGNFRLTDPDGRDIRIAEKKGRVLLAMLATAPDQRRSREWLKSRLWGRSFDDQASNSLRQSLYALRRQLGPWSDVLQADYEHVWLNALSVQMDPGSNSRIGFFEDAPRLDEDGEDWLRDERQAFEARVEDDRGAMVDTGHSVPVAPVTFEAPPCVLIGNPVVVSDDPLAGVVAERITNAMVSTFRQNGFLETYDLRDVETNQLAGRETDSVVRPPILIEVRVSLMAQELQSTVLARVPATGRVVWTSSIGSDRESALAIGSETMMEFVMGAVDTVESLILRQPGLATKPTLYTAVHQLFGMSRDGIKDSADLLTRFVNEQYSANAEAWLAFAAMLRRNELREDQGAALAEAERHVAQAMETDPGNAVVLAIAGHFEGFSNYDLALGAQYLTESRRILPNLAFAWDATAMNAIYSGDIERGARTADMARNLGRYSPYKFYYDASAMIAATLQGRHADAISLGRRVLAKRPEFLAVLRHMFISHIRLGQMDEAMACYRQLRQIDEDFGTERMGHEDYARSSAASLDLIRGGLQEIGLLN